ncbi:longitudinals lacking protein-like isoform X1 [Anastrepha ludens]|uniref:longitudinals lacking protein-like isoform X1 n=1 Tax=Anastrepha ludens TaxID=28586 RepID=UPI0023B176C5|nr:longitudinals lacking protein-like isoform X1 [Anastrepha ludens]
MNNSAISKEINGFIISVQNSPSKRCGTTQHVFVFKLKSHWHALEVTLACEGQTCKAHKMVLSACSPYFKALLEENPSKHPIIILKDVSYIHLQAILEFMYAGEVNVSQEQLPAFLKTADRLKVKGLAETPSSIKREG